MKNKTLVKILSLVTGLVAGISLVSVSFASDFESYTPYVSAVSANATDTLAGYTSIIKSSSVGAGTDVVFRIRKPDDSVVDLPAKASLDGRATLEFANYHTRIAGEYEVSAKLQGDGNFGDVTSFKVLAGDVSGVNSVVTPTEQVVRIGRELGEVEVTLKDIFENPINGHMIELISSRATDSVETVSNISDLDGKVVFDLNSAESGVSTYTVYDLTANEVLNERAKVVYFTSSEELFGDTKALIGHASSGNSSGPVSYLAFDDLPDVVSAGQSASFTITAYDDSNQVVTDYNGAVHFSTVLGNDASVSFPSDYTFKPEDLGSHSFALSLVFTTAGSYILQAEDMSDISIFGTTPVTVVASGGNVSDLVSITNPTAGTYSNNVHVISGKATPGMSIAIYDNGVQIGTVTADTVGNFMFTTGLLPDGDHEFYAAILNEAGTITASSAKVKLTIDMTAPQIEKVETVPAGSVPAGSEVEVKVYAEASLSQVTLEVSGNTYQTEDSPDGYYSAKFKAPSAEGTYPIKITLVDALGNESKIDDEAFLTVGQGGVSDSSVGDVAGLVAYPGDHKVALGWQAPAAGDPIQFYRVYYGLSANQLNFAVDTWDAKTTWYVPDLKNEVEYFFAVVAVSNSGATSVHMSNIVSGIPGTVVEMPPIDVLNGTAGGENLQNMEKDVSETGPEMMWLFLAAILGGLFYSYSSSKRVGVEEVVED